MLAFALTIVTTFSVKNLHAQTKEDAIVAFNAALELSKTNLDGAIVKMQDVVKMCTTIGADADTLKMKAGTVIPVWQYNVANNLITSKKYNLAIAAYEKSNALAVKYGDDNIKEKSAGQLTILYKNKGYSAYQANKLDSAVIYLDKSLSFDPNYATAMYLKGLIYKKKGDDAKMIENMKLAAETAAKTNDSMVMKAANTMIGANLNQEGIDAFNKKSYTEAVEKLNSALALGFKTKNLYYVLATSNNFLKKYDEAIEAAKAGMAMDDQTNEKLARYYCEIAKAYEGKNDTENACANYKKSVYGPFAKFANDKIKNVLKCQ